MFAVCLEVGSVDRVINELADLKPQLSLPERAEHWVSESAEQEDELPARCMLLFIKSRPCENTGPARDAVPSSGISRHVSWHF